jgi:hypothetical protein
MKKVLVLLFLSFSLCCFSQTTKEKNIFGLSISNSKKEITYELNDTAFQNNSLNYSIIQKYRGLNFHFLYSPFFETSIGVGFRSSRYSFLNDYFLAVNQQFYLNPLFSTKDMRIKLYIPVLLNLIHYTAINDQFFFYDGVVSGVGIQINFYDNLNACIEIHKQFAIDNDDFGIFTKYGLVYYFK